jgi:hypothetical protein
MDMYISFSQDTVEEAEEEVKKERTFICNLSDMSKSSETMFSDQILVRPSSASTKQASWTADHRMKAL